MISTCSTRSAASRLRILELFHPSLLLHDGNYFLMSHFSPELYADWMKQLKDPIAVQKVLNHIHVSTLFQQQRVPDVVAAEAAKQIASIWSKIFLDRGLVAEASGESLHNAEVTLFRKS
jgi:hypothetical protein